VIYAQNNDADPNNSVDIEVDGFKQTIFIPHRQHGQFHAIYCHHGFGYFVTPDFGPQPDHLRFVSAWGTKPRSTDLMAQRQDNNVVQFVGDYDFDFDYGVSVSGDGRWRYRGNSGGWPAKRCNVIYLRGECGRKANEGAGICQINFASRCTEGTSSTGSMSFRAQVKGYSTPGNRDAANDMVRVVIDPAINQLGVMINDRSIGLYLNSGFELIL
jgi:hypothetical protein